MFLNRLKKDSITLLHYAMITACLHNSLKTVGVLLPREELRPGGEQGSAFCEAEKEISTQFSLSLNIYTNNQSLHIFIYTIMILADVKFFLKSFLTKL